MDTDSDVAAYAKHYRLPHALARAIVERESNWQVCTVSPKGAVGLMQLMPRTAQQPRVPDPRNPDKNVSGGFTMIFGSLQRLLRWARKDHPERALLRNPDFLDYVSFLGQFTFAKPESNDQDRTTPQKTDVR